MVRSINTVIYNSPARPGGAPPQLPARPSATAKTCPPACAPPERVKQHNRQTLFGRVLKQAGQLFRQRPNPWTYHEMAVHDGADHQFPHRRSYTRRLARLRPASPTFQPAHCRFSFVAPGSGSGCRCQIGVQLSKAVLIRDLTDARARKQSIRIVRSANTMQFLP